MLPGKNIGVINAAPTYNPEKCTKEGFMFLKPMDYIPSKSIFTLNVIYPKIQMMTKQTIMKI